MTPRQKIHVMIVDDEKLIRDELKYMLMRFPEFVICCETGDGSEALDLIERKRPDVVFLDIHLQTENGLSIAEKITQGNHRPIIILATAYTEYAVKGFEIGALDYLVKPFEMDRLERCYQRIKESIALKGSLMESENSRVVIFDHGRYKLVDFKDILYLECSEGGLNIHTKGQVFQTAMTLKVFEDRCHDPAFVRIHKSYIVNTNHIKEIIPWFNSTLKLILTGISDKEIYVSRSYARSFKNTFGI